MGSLTEASFHEKSIDRNASPRTRKRYACLKQSKHAPSLLERVTMAEQPVLVTAYTERRGFSRRARTHDQSRAVLPAISSYAFAEILQAVNGPELQSALDGIAEIWAKHKLSLADEYSVHLPPFTELSAASTIAPPLPARRSLFRTGTRPALTSVPEASSSSSSSDGSRRIPTAVVGRLLAVQIRHNVQACHAVRRLQIGCTGHAVPVHCTTALAIETEPASKQRDINAEAVLMAPNIEGVGLPESDPFSTAKASLQRILATTAHS